MLALIFPGLGSQRPRMGEDLFDGVAEYRRVERDVDTILGHSARELCLGEHEGLLRKPELLQPCLYVVNALHYYAAGGEELEPGFAAGHNVGEYNALLAAGAFDFLTGLRLVRKRGELTAKTASGGMAAVVGLPARRVHEIIGRHELAALDIANFNAPLQTVVAGPVEEIARAKQCFEQAGASRYVALDVTGAFHSRYMKAAEAAFRRYLKAFAFRRTKLPVIANVTGEPYPQSDADWATRALLALQISEPVEWRRSIRYLVAHGAANFAELGAGRVLGSLIAQTRRELLRAS
jgi:malonyl CoA-acyl carrier protein transacylase